MAQKTKKATKKATKKVQKKSRQGTPKISTKRVVEILTMMCACEEAVRFAKKQKTGGDVWSNCKNVDWIEWICTELNIIISTWDLVLAYLKELRKKARTEKEKKFFSKVFQEGSEITLFDIPPGKAFQGFRDSLKCSSCGSDFRKGNLRDRSSSIFCHIPKVYQPNVYREVVKKGDLLRALIKHAKEYGY